MSTDKPEYFGVKCPKCGWVGSSEESAGGTPIADSGDFSDLVCPHCPRWPGVVLEDASEAELCDELKRMRAPLSSVTGAAARTDEEEARWQFAILDELMRHSGAPGHALDASGTDSGDALDYTLVQIRKAFGYLKEEGASVESRYLGEAALESAFVKWWEENRSAYIVGEEVSAPNMIAYGGFMAAVRYLRRALVTPPPIEPPLRQWAEMVRDSRCFTNRSGNSGYQIDGEEAVLVRSDYLGVLLDKILVGPPIEPPRDLESMAEAVHNAYLATCAALGWSVKPENQVPYSALTEASKELDRASVRAVLACLPAARPPVEADKGAATLRTCTCLGSCKGADGLSPGWICALKLGAPGDTSKGGGHAG